MKTISTFVIPLLVFSFLLIALPKTGLSQEFGCCRNFDLNVCVGCGEIDCATTRDFCEDENNTNQFLPGSRVCDEQGTNISECDDIQPQDTGCCFIETNNCIGLPNVGAPSAIECFESLEGERWFSETSCAEVPGCGVIPPTQPPIVRTNVPTLSQWGFISLAVVLALVGLGAILVRRKKASA